MRLVIVDWVDSYGCPAGWESLKFDTDLRCLHVRSVGWLLQDGRESKTLVPHLSDPAYSSTNPQAAGRLTIPTRSILKIHTLTDPRSSQPPPKKSRRQQLTLGTPPVIATLADSDPTFESRLEKRLEAEKAKIARETPSVAELFRKISQ
jgi:hypothetical protein